MTATSQNPLGAGTALISQKGTLLTAAAMVLAYYQTGGQIGSPNGQATPDTLNKYLTSCGTGCDGFLTNPDTGEQVVNLWRLSGFGGGLTDISVEKRGSSVPFRRWSPADLLFWCFCLWPPTAFQWAEPRWSSPG